MEAMMEMNNNNYNDNTVYCRFFSYKNASGVSSLLIVVFAHGFSTELTRLFPN